MKKNYFRAYLIYIWLAFSVVVLPLYSMNSKNEIILCKDVFKKHDLLEKFVTVNTLTSAELALLLLNLLFAERCFSSRVHSFEDFGFKLDPKDFANIFVLCFGGEDGSVGETLSPGNLLAYWDQKLSKEQLLACVEELRSYTILERFWKKFTVGEQLATLKSIWSALKGPKSSFDFSESAWDTIALLNQDQAADFASHVFVTTPQHLYQVLCIIWGNLTAEKKIFFLQKDWHQSTRKQRHFLLDVVNALPQEQHDAFMKYVLQEEGPLMCKISVFNALRKNFSKEQITFFGLSLCDQLKLDNKGSEKKIRKSLKKGDCETLFQEVANRACYNNGTLRDQVEIVMFFLGKTRLQFFKQVFDSSNSKHKCMLVNWDWKNLPEKEVRPYYLNRLKKECSSQDIKVYASGLKL